MEDDEGDRAEQPRRPFMFCCGSLQPLPVRNREAPPAKAAEGKVGTEALTWRWPGPSRQHLSPQAELSPPGVASPMAGKLTPEAVRDLSCRCFLRGARVEAMPFSTR